jgi:hypothetical protein
MAEKYRTATLKNKVFAALQKLCVHQKRRQTLKAATQKVQQISLKQSFDQLNLELENLPKQITA